MKKLIAIAAAAAGIATFAAAQNEAVGSFSVRAGVAWPTSSDLSGTFFGLGVDYDFGKSLLGGTNGSTYLSFDWITKSTNARRANLYPIMINQKFQLSTSKEEGSLPIYGFIGVGAAIIDFGQSSTQLAGRIGLGAKVSTNVFFESAFVITGRAKGTSIQGNHIGLWLGYKF